MCSTKDIKTILNTIRKDNLSGSGALLAGLLSGLSECTQKPGTYTAEELTLLPELFGQFKSDMADFAVISHFCDFILNSFKAESIQSSNDLQNIIERYRKDWQGVNSRIADVFMRNVDIKGKTVLLHSQSSTIISLFEKLKNISESVNIIQTESRPMYEGRLQAEKLAALGFNVKLVTDTGFTPLLDNIDLSILGADRIYSNVLINKTGSYAIGLLCRKKNIPVYVLADSRKFIRTDKSATETLKTKPGSEIWSNSPRGITPVNHYFEQVPLDVITKVITEK
jgi:translation initiation factor 2B subunit (eIF-2B alpha/beta/delta family)